MSAMLQDIPLGKWRTETGITGLIEVIEHKILRLILGAQKKVPVEMRYLETAELPLKNGISVRRLLCVHTIIKRHKSEITRKVYTEMKEDPYKGDWINLVKKDLENIGFNL